MRRIIDVRLPAPLDRELDQLHQLEITPEGIIRQILPMATGDLTAGESWNGDWLSPRGIDLQINGGLGLAFPELKPSDLPRLIDLLDQLWADGVEAIAPTLVTCGIAPLRQALSVQQGLAATNRPAVAACWEPIWKDPFWRMSAAAPTRRNTWRFPALRRSMNASAGSKRRSP